MTRTVSPSDFAALALMEAIEALQLVKAEALPDLLKALPTFMSDPRYVLELRKSGTQLTSGEKAELGMGPRAFMSKQLLEHLPPQGMRDPANAHEMTLQRASHSLSRYENLEQAKTASLPLKVRRVCPYTAGCIVADTWSDLEAVDALPPKECRDDAYRTCRSAFTFRRAGRA